MRATILSTILQHSTVRTIAMYISIGLSTASLLAMFLAREFRNHKLEEIIEKIPLILFLICWFGVLSFLTYNLIKQEGAVFGLGLLPFWLFGGFIIYRYLLKK